MVSANTNPFMRFKKPQPPFLSRVLRDKILQKAKWITHLKRLEFELKDARQEDRWDRLVAQMEESFASTTASNDRTAYPGVTAEPSWKAAIERGLRHLSSRLSSLERKNIILARKMQKIVDQERELVEKEQRERAEQEKRSTALKKGTCEG